jgi:3'(2'), 5'-bisphosphate nucleotidase
LFQKCNYKLTNLAPKFQTALIAAVEASHKIMEIYNHDFEAIIKEDGSPLTKADLASTTIIQRHLEPLGIPITGEETEKLDYSIRQNWTECWCVDPLDGTKEFINKNGEFAVNIALIENGIPTFGLIASPVNEEIIFGSKEFGVYISSFENIEKESNWKKISVPKKVNLPLILTASRSHGSGPMEGFIAELKQISPEIEQKSKGSSLKFFDIAKGEVDVYARFAPTMEWDIASGQAILEALGGSVINVETGLPLSYNKANLLNPFFIAKTKPLLEILP